MNTRTILFKTIRTPVLLGLVFCGTCHSAQAHIQKEPLNVFPLSEYQATYKVSWHGLHSGTSSHSLKKQPNGQYFVQSETHPKIARLPFHYSESSHFAWQTGKILPQRYTYNIQEGRKHKIGNVIFDWPANKISNKQLAQPWETDMPEDIHDKLTQTLQLRCDLKSPQTSFRFNVAEKDKFKTYQFDIVGHERLKTKLGVVNTVKVENISRKGYKTITWMAKEFDYLPVKMQQERNGKVAASGEIESWKRL